jgi:CHAT domain-containing protein/Tfp pilus assembly protein PilF
VIRQNKHHSAIDRSLSRAGVRGAAIFLPLLLLFSLPAIFSSDKVFGREVDLERQSAQQTHDANGATGDEKEISALEPGRRIKRAMAGGQRHSYQVKLDAGQFLKVIVEQLGIDVVILVYGPDGELLSEMDSENRLPGQDGASLVAEVAGDYRVALRPRLEKAPAGDYEIRIEDLRAATGFDRDLYKARRIYQEARQLLRSRDYDRARPLFEQTLEILEKSLGPDNKEVAITLNRIANCYRNTGEYEKAERLSKRALATLEKRLGPWHPSVADALDDLAALYISRGEYAKAEPLYNRALKIQETAFGAWGHKVAESLNHLANLYFYGLGDVDVNPEPLYLRAIAILERAQGPEHPDITDPLCNLAALYYSRGDYVKPEPLNQRALAIIEKASGPEDPLAAYPLSNLAGLYRERGEEARAIPLYERALRIREKAYGPEHPDVADSLTSFAHIYRDRGEYAKAESMYLRALSIREKVKGAEHSDIADSLDNLALLYVMRSEYKKAEPMYQRALAIWEKTHGPEDHRVAYSLNNLALLHARNGEYAKAEPLYERALAILEKTKGPEHLYVVRSLSALARLRWAKGDLHSACAVLSRANAIGERNLARNLIQGSERRKQAYLALFSEQTDFTLSLQSQAMPDDPQALDLALTTLLRWKGRGLDAMADTVATLRHRAAPQNQILFDQLAEARSRLAALTLGAATASPETYRAKLKPLEEEVENLESQLSSRSAEFRAQSQSVTLAAVQSALPAGSALIEFAVFTPQGPLAEKSGQPRYLAYLLPARGQPRWRDLGEAAIIDHAVEDWRQALRDPGRVDVNRLARAVDERVMRPVRSLLTSAAGQTRQLLIAPDGWLNLIPFAALVDERNRYLVERYAITYLTSGRDLLRLQMAPPSRNVPLIVANPDFGRVETLAASGDQAYVNSQAESPIWGEIDPATIFFQSLPGTEREALAIKAMLPGASLLRREQATETALKLAKAPRILHIATHGFFFSDQEAQQPEARTVHGDDLLRFPTMINKWAAKIENPLLRSGVALAGVNERRSGDDDGALTALEVASLDLWGTRLVVLSGCDTGVGEVKNGEGVYGLRRALVLAGSETQVMSLWPILDDKTGNLMAAYYKRLLKGEGRGAALRQIQLGMLKDTRLRHPHYWGSFIQAGEWANLDGRRRPRDK